MDAPYFQPVPVTCPFCGGPAETYQGRLQWHLALGFICCAVNMTMKQAAELEIDEQGQLIGLDEMALR